LLKTTIVLFFRYIRYAHYPNYSLQGYNNEQTRV